MNRKRSSAEPVEALLSEEAPAAPNATRPASLALGAALVLGRAVATLFWLAGFTLVWPELVRELDLTGAEAPIAYWFVVVVCGIATLVLVLFAWLIWRGSNTARVITMIVLTLSIVSAAIGYFADGQEITVRTTLLTLAFDILILLALSSRDARAWARRAR